MLRFALAAAITTVFLPMAAAAQTTRDEVTFLTGLVKIDTSNPPGN